LEVCDVLQQTHLRRKHQPNAVRRNRDRQRVALSRKHLSTDGESEEKHEPVSDIDTAAADNLKVLDPKWPIREADIPIWPRRGTHTQR